MDGMLEVLREESRSWYPLPTSDGHDELNRRQKDGRWKMLLVDIKLGEGRERKSPDSSWVFLRRAVRPNTRLCGYG